jgi:hypothetical protein
MTRPLPGLPRTGTRMRSAVGYRHRDARVGVADWEENGREVYREEAANWRTVVMNVRAACVSVRSRR